MQTLQTILTLTQPNCYRTTIGLKDVWWCLMDGDNTYFLKFLCSAKILKFVALPIYLSPGPRKFTKLTKIPLVLLWKQGYTAAIYSDGIIALDQSLAKCPLTVVTKIDLFQKHGFVIHPDKIMSMPNRIMEYLGFIIESKEVVTSISDAL